MVCDGLCSCCRSDLTKQIQLVGVVCVHQAGWIPLVSFVKLSEAGSAKAFGKQALQEDGKLLLFSWGNMPKRLSWTSLHRKPKAAVTAQLSPRQGKGGKADPTAWMGMLAFVPKLLDSSESSGPERVESCFVSEGCNPSSLGATLTRAGSLWPPETVGLWCQDGNSWCFHVVSSFPLESKQVMATKSLRLGVVILRTVVFKCLETLQTNFWVESLVKRKFQVGSRRTFTLGSIPKKSTMSKRQSEIHGPSHLISPIQGLVCAGYSGRWTTLAATTDLCTFGSPAGCCRSLGPKEHRRHVNTCKYHFHPFSVPCGWGNGHHLWRLCRCDVLARAAELCGEGYEADGCWWMLMDAYGCLWLFWFIWVREKSTLWLPNMFISFPHAKARLPTSSCYGWALGSQRKVHFGLGERPQGGSARSLVQRCFMKVSACFSTTCMANLESRQDLKPRVLEDGKVIITMNWSFAQCRLRFPHTMLSLTDKAYTYKSYNL